MSGIVYQEVFWIFMAGNILGVIVEGLWCLFRYGKWQTHVVTIWGPFNIVYGIGMAMFFVVDEMFYGNTAQKSRRDTARSDIIKTWINR